VYETPGVVAIVCEITPGALPQQLFRSTRRSPSAATIELGTLEIESCQSAPPPLTVQSGIVSVAPKYPIGAQKPWLPGQPPLTAVVSSYPSSKLPFRTRLSAVTRTSSTSGPAHVPLFSRLSNEITVDQLVAVKPTEAACQRLVPSRYPSARGSAETTVEGLPSVARRGFGPK
jgi:hypothetical protein